MTAVKQQSGQIDPSTKATQEEPRAPETFSFTDVPGLELTETKTPSGPVSLQRKVMEGDVPELPLPERGATLGKMKGPSSLNRP